MIFENIAALCEERGISIARLEREVGIGNGIVGKWANSSPTVEKLKKVADYLGVTVDSLLTVRRKAQK